MSAMTPRERILGAIRHQPVDRLGIDAMVGISPTYIGPELKTDDGIHYDEWGMGYRNQVYGTGDYDARD